MAGALGTQSRWTLDSASQGNVRLRRVKSSKTSDGASVEAKNAVGEDFPVGFIDKPGAKTITFEVFAQRGKAEADFRALRDNKEEFGLYKKIVGGPGYHYPICRVSKIDDDDDDEGGHMFSVEIVALREEKL